MICVVGDVVANPNIAALSVFVVTARMKLFVIGVVVVAVVDIVDIIVSCSIVVACSVVVAAFVIYVVAVVFHF